MHLDVGGPTEAAPTSVTRVFGLTVHLTVLTQVAPLAERLATHTTWVLACRLATVACSAALNTVHHQQTKVHETDAAVATQQVRTSDITGRPGCRRCTRIDTKPHRQPRSSRLQNQAGMLQVWNRLCIVSQVELPQPVYIPFLVTATLNLWVSDGNNE